ncbi:MAG TPA: hypothetical protein DFR83_11575, partial [Deltaproteobacteria bacterium]|nr:hypothetical protein [Deltaproteobacteria bacterium]
MNRQTHLTGMLVLALGCNDSEPNKDDDLSATVPAHDASTGGSSDDGGDGGNDGDGGDGGD